ncbi:MAG: hypothetical protein DME65_04880 [Verrucomicrobia bacterium]|nr:MAG: hypothetical protein DME65_04880 [Verrucomicrobiota bacterium]
MDDASGKFVLVMLRADQVRVHHKKTKHEYKFHVSGDPPEVGMCALHPNPAAPIDPRNYREEARAAAQWFVAKRSASHMPVLGVRPSFGWINM